LWTSLSDPGLGSSAAAVLARHADRNTVNRLATLLDSTENLVQKRALLALRLSGDARAKQIARDWLAQSRPDNESDR